jgi:predicted alpha/beta-hydrolase family hydrolase
MLFLQGTRDELASQPLLEGVCERLGTRATLKWWQDADHSFHVPVKSGRKDEQVLNEILDVMKGWIEQLL